MGRRSGRQCIALRWQVAVADRSSLRASSPAAALQLVAPGDENPSLMLAPVVGPEQLAAGRLAPLGQREDGLPVPSPPTDGGQPASTSQLRRRPIAFPVAPEAATATAQTAIAIRAVSAPMPPPQPAMRHTKHAGTLIDTAIGDDVNLNCNGQLETAAPAPAFAARDCEAAAGEHPATSPLRPPAEPPPPP